MTPHDHTDAARVVLTEIARADRRRRAREMTFVLVRVAPIGAASVLVLAAVGRWLGWRPVLPLSLLGILGIVLVIGAIVGRRARAASDATAARVDADAGLGGELRSAHWFASESAQAPWPRYHLDRAATRLGGVAWDQVYPPVRAPRAWSMAALCVIASLGLSYRVPPPVRAASRGPAGSPGAASTSAAALPPELAKQLMDLLAKAQAGNLSAEDAKRLADASNLLKKIDPNADPKLADLAKRLQAAAEAAKDATKNLADAGKADAAADDLKAAMEDLASKLAKGQAEQSKNNPTGGPNSDDKDFGKSSSSAGQAKSVQASVQLVREAAADAGDAQQMTPAGGSPGGDSSAGRGGNNGGKGAGELMKIQADALKRELVEANQDIAGQNVTKEDLRRKTEQGKSSLAFTHTAAVAAVDRGRAVPPPPVPDARKALVQSYFIRKQ